MARVRKSGILLHPTSLPGPGGIGSLGVEARGFVDFLRDAGQSIWQILPLGPTAFGNSPYMCYSAFAGNPLLIDLRLLAEEGDLSESTLEDEISSERVAYDLAKEHKAAALGRAATNFFASAGRSRQEEFWHFCDTTPWLHDYALFMALKGRHGGKKWCDWPERFALRHDAALEEASSLLGTEIGVLKYSQWQFFRQWHSLKAYANQRGIGVFGDIPIFVAFDSAEVWANPRLFQLDGMGRPRVVAGVPPDYFSSTGQLWGNPLYDWEEMARCGYAWWIDRFRSALMLHDLVRIDHFRGFEACWEVPAGDKTAERGAWVKGPGEAVFHAFRQEFGELPVVAEDLGVITHEVEQLRDKFSFPGMKILHFAFDSGPDNPYLPHNHVRNSVVYTGTHDNDTTAGWFGSLSRDARKKVLHYLGASGKDFVWDLMRVALASVADTAIIPLQDVLELPGSCRMNLPGSASGNWSWRFSPQDLSGRLADRLADLSGLYGRNRSEQGGAFSFQTTPEGEQSCQKRN